MKYYFLRYTDDPKVHGHCKGPIMTLNRKYKDNKALIAHEEEHIKQWYIMSASLAVTLIPLTNFLNSDLLVLAPALVLAGHNAIYEISRKYRLYCETKAFAKQLGVDGWEHITLAATFLARDYNLGITEEEAIKSLEKYRNV